MKILIADSNPKTIESIGLCCSIRWPHRQLLSTGDPEELLSMVERESPDVVVLDADLLGGAGYNLCQSIRTFSTVPLIMLTSTGEETEIVKALDVAGADDCVSKPVRPLELLARIIALLRRSQGLPPASRVRPFISDGLYVDFDTGEVRVNDSEVKLTFTEFEILRCLMHNARRVVPVTKLASLVWGEDGTDYRSTLKVHIQHLRQKLGETANHPRYIINERGFGYKFVGA